MRLFSRLRSRSLSELTRQITPPTKNGHASFFSRAPLKMAGSRKRKKVSVRTLITLYMGIEEVDRGFAMKSYKRFIANKIVDSKGCFIPHKKPRNDGYVRFSVTKGSTQAALGKAGGERTFPLSSRIPREQ
jgi:hypothetical protein